MADFLQQLYSALGGMQQPPTQLGIGGQQQQTPTPAATPGLFDMLSTPGAQGLLGAYLGYLSRPRGLNTNAWQGIGLGGLSGLQAMQGARAQELALPLQAAQTREAIAKAGLTESEAQFYQKNPQAAGYHYAPEYEKGVVATAANKRGAQDLRAQAMTVTDPAMKQRMLSAADVVEASPEYIHPDKFPEIIADPTLKGKAEQTKIALQQALTQQVGKPGGTWATTPEGEVMPITATGKAPPKGSTKFGERPPTPSYKAYILDPSQPPTAPGNVVNIDTKTEAPPPGSVPYSPSTGKPPKPPMPGAVEGKAAATLKSLEATYEKLNPKPVGEGLRTATGIGTGAIDSWNKGYRQFVRQHGLDPKDGKPLPPIEPGWTYDESDDGETIAIDPNGVPHRYDPNAP